MVILSSKARVGSNPAITTRILLPVSLNTGMRADQRKFHYIYKISRTDGSGRYYIGMHSTDDLEDGYFGSGMLLWKSIRKHGKEKHSKEILEFLPSRKELKERERQLVNEEILNDPRCMNLQLGGEGGWCDSHQDHFAALQQQFAAGSDAAKARSAKSAKTQSAMMLAGALAPPSFSGMKHTAETRRKMSMSQSGKQRGEKNSQYGTCWVNQNGNALKIKRELLEKYLATGYQRGRKGVPNC